MEYVGRTASYNSFDSLSNGNFSPDTIIALVLRDLSIADKYLILLFSSSGIFPDLESFNALINKSE